MDVEDKVFASILYESVSGKESVGDLGGTRMAEKWTTWDEARKELYSSEEIAASDLRVALMVELIKARNEKGSSQKELEELSGVSQPVIARMERGVTKPQLDTVIKVLASLGKKLVIVPM